MIFIFNVEFFVYFYNAFSVGHATVKAECNLPLMLALYCLRLSVVVTWRNNSIQIVNITAYNNNNEKWSGLPAGRRPWLGCSALAAVHRVAAGAP